MYKRFLVALPLHYDVHISNDHENHLNALFMQCVQFLFYSAKKNKKNTFFWKANRSTCSQYVFTKKKLCLFCRGMAHTWWCLESWYTSDWENMSIIISIGLSILSWKLASRVQQSRAPTAYLAMYLVFLVLVQVCDTVAAHDTALCCCHFDFLCLELINVSGLLPNRRLQPSWYTCNTATSSRFFETFLCLNC